ARVETGDPELITRVPDYDPGIAGGCRRGLGCRGGARGFCGHGARARRGRLAGGDRGGRATRSQEDAHHGGSQCQPVGALRHGPITQPSQASYAHAYLTTAEITSESIHSARPTAIRFSLRYRHPMAAATKAMKATIRISVLRFRCAILSSSCDSDQSASPIAIRSVFL